MKCLFVCVRFIITKVRSKKSLLKQKKALFCLHIKKVYYICRVLIFKQKTK